MRRPYRRLLRAAMPVPGRRPGNRPSALRRRGFRSAAPAASATTLAGCRGRLPARGGRRVRRVGSAVLAVLGTTAVPVTVAPALAVTPVVTVVAMLAVLARWMMDRMHEHGLVGDLVRQLEAD